MSGYKNRCDYPHSAGGASMCPDCSPKQEAVGEEGEYREPIDIDRLPERLIYLQENIKRGYYGKGKGKNIKYLLMIISQLIAQIRKMKHE